MEETAKTEQEIAKIEAELSKLANRHSQLLADLTQLRQRLLHNNTPAQKQKRPDV